MPDFLVQICRFRLRKLDLMTQFRSMCAFVACTIDAETSEVQTFSDNHKVLFILTTHGSCAENDERCDNFGTNDRFNTENDGLCTKVDELCLKHDRFNAENDGLCTKFDELCLKHDRFNAENDGLCTRSGARAEADLLGERGDFLLRNFDFLSRNVDFPFEKCRFMLKIIWILWQN